MIRSDRKQRSLNACLIAGIVHVSIAILLTFFHYTRIANEFEDAVGVELIDMKNPETQQRKLKRPSSKKLLIP